MNKSAVEFLVKELNEKAIFGGTIDRIVMNNIIEQAKEMEKEQQGYSEEEVIELLQKALTHQDNGEIGSLVTAQGEIRPANFFSWFEQFKNK